MKKMLFLASALFWGVLAMASQSWALKNPMSSALQGSVGGSIGGRVYIVGGGNLSGCTNQTMEYNPMTDTYTMKAPFPGPARMCASSFVINNRLYVGLGVGQTFGQGPYPDWYAYDPAADAWTVIASMPDSFAYAASAAAGGNGYVFGGFNDLAGMQNSFIWKYDPTTDTWSTIAQPQTMASFYGATAFAINDIVYVGTGWGMTDFWQFDPVTEICTTIAPFPGQPRSGAVAFTLGEIGIVGGGTTGCDWYADFFAYDVVTGSWAVIDSLNAPRSGAVGASALGNGYVIGGAHQVGIYTPETWEYGSSLTTGISGHPNISVSVFPNPFTDSFFVELPDATACSITLYDALGRQMLREEQAMGKTEVHCRDLPPGTYLLRIEGKNIFYSGKIIAQ